MTIPLKPLTDTGFRLKYFTFVANRYNRLFWLPHSFRNFDEPVLVVQHSMLHGNGLVRPSEIFINRYPYIKRSGIAAVPPVVMGHLHFVFTRHGLFEPVFGYAVFGP